MSAFTRKFLLKSLPAIVSTVATVAALVLLVGLGAQTSEAAKKGGTLKVGMETGYRGFDADTAGVVNPPTAMTMVEALFTVDLETSTSVPALGLSMEPAKDGKSWTVKIRKGVKFHDGTDLDAAAVAFNYNRIRTGNCRCKAFIATITKVEAVDKYTVKFNLKHPWGAFASSVTGPAAFAYIHSPTAIKKMGKDYNRNPVGTGPFKFVEWRSGDRVVVERNDNYWKKGLPYLDKIIFRIIPDTESRYASVLTKDVDLMWTDRANHILKARKNEKLATLSGLSNGAATTFLNHSKPPLDDARVRTALQLAYDNDLYAKAAWKGVNPPVTHPYGPNIPGCQQGYPKPDLERAKQLIKEYGKPVSVTLTHTTTARGREGAQIMQQMWKKIGVTTVMNPVDQPTLIRKVVTGDYQISGWRMVYEIDPFLDIQTVGTFYSKSPANYGKYANPMMDKLVLGGRMTSDPKKRAGLYCKVAQLIAKDVPLLFRGALMAHLIFQPDVKGVTAVRSRQFNTTEAWLDR